MILKIGSKGFTLLEVLITVAIVSIGISAVLRAYITSFDAMKDSQEYITAVSLAKNRMAELLQMEIDYKGISLGSAKGSFQSPYDYFSWTSEITSSDIKDLNAVKVTVFNSIDTSPKEFSLVNYVQNKKD